MPLIMQIKIQDRAREGADPQTQPATIGINAGLGQTGQLTDMESAADVHLSCLRGQSEQAAEHCPVIKMVIKISAIWGAPDRTSAATNGSENGRFPMI